MTRRRILLRATVACALVLCAGALVVSAPARAIGQPAPIRSASEIGYPPFCLVDSEGRATGFSVELLRESLAAMGRGVTFSVGEWADVRGRLDSGEVDVLPLVGRTPERELLYDFTFPYMTLHGAIVVRQDTQGIESLDDLRGKTVAVMKGDNAEEFMRRADTGAILVTTATYDEALRNLASGSYDAVVVQRLVATLLIRENQLVDLRVVETPVEGFEQDFCFAVRAGDAETLALVNEGLSLVMANGTYRHLHAKWFAALELPTNRPIVVGGDWDYPPYEYIDSEGRAAGFAVDLTRAIANQLGLNVEIRLGDWSDTRAAFERGEVDVMQGMFYSPERDLDYDFSPPHTKSLGVAIVRSGTGDPPGSAEQLEGKTVVVQEGDIMHDFAVANDLSVVTVGTPKEALFAVAAGLYDCALLSRTPALHLIQEQRLTNLVVGSKPLVTLDYCYAVLDGQSALLASFSEGLAVLEESGEYREIYDKWMGVYEDSSPDVLTILRYVAYGVGPLLALLLVVLLWLRLLRKQVARRTAELKKSQEHYRYLTENSVDTIWTTNMDLEFTFTSGANLDKLGYTEEEWVGTRLHDHCDSATAARVTSLLAREAQAGPEAPGVILEVELRAKDGRIIPYEVHARVLWNDHIAVGAQGIARDISDRRREEAERARLREQLQQSQKMEAIGQLAGGIAHDFNNLLAAIIGYTDLLLSDDDLPQRSRSDLEQILRSAERAASLTGQILAFSRRQPLRPTVVSLNAVIEEMEPLLRRTIGENIELVVRADPALGHVAADVHQFEQVILNLAVNARNAMPNSGTLTLRTANVSLDGQHPPLHADVPPGPYVVLTISDTGVGMDEATREHVFEPFFTTMEPGKGTGLGLATVYGIVAQSGGVITVESEPGKGTTFTICLPRVEAPAAEKEAETPQRRAQGGNETILVVEDEEALRPVLVRVLSDLGYRVHSAGTVADALDVVARENGRPDLLVTDMVLPGRGQGTDLAMKLRESWPDLPVVFMSGYTQSGVVRDGRVVEGVNFLQKPFAPDSLAVMVRSVLDARAT